MTCLASMVQLDKLECKTVCCFSVGVYWLMIDPSLLLFVLLLLIYSPDSGTENHTKGTAFVVYEDIFDAKNACEHLSGFSMQGRYLVVLYHQPDREARKRELERQQRELEEIRAKMGQIEG